MRKYYIEPSKENIINSLNNDIIKRNSDLVEFIKIIDNMEGNFFVSLDGEWGTGKTFFVKQLEMVLNYYRNLQNENKSDNEMDSVIHNDKLDKLELKNSYMTVYYNSWLYDNHNDPMLSLIYSITQNNDTKLDVSKQSDFKTKLINILKTIDFWHINSIVSVIASLQDENILEQIRTLEEVKEQIYDILDNLISENCDKLVIIIDELDRCNPNYAVNVLERIKHYFNDERIIFIVAVNKSQLIHTISNCYGLNFDSTRYLNKFFDFNMKLSKVNIVNYVQSLKLITNSGYNYNRMTYAILNYMDFSIRDASIYIQQLSSVENIIINMNSSYSFVCSMFVPIIVALRLSDIHKSSLIENGNGKDILDNLINDIDYLKKMIKNLSKIATQQDDNTIFEDGKIEFYKMYDFIYGNNSNQNNMYDGKYELFYGIKDTLIKLCNSQIPD